MTELIRDMCLRRGPAVSPTFTPVCTLAAGHDGACNWDDRVALRNRLRAEAAAARAEASRNGTATAGSDTRISSEVEGGGFECVSR